MEKRANNILMVYIVFAVVAEMMHISLNGAPPMYMRLVYISIHLLFCLFYTKLIPVFVSVSMIMQNFSVVFGEFLPATMYFNIALMGYCYFRLRWVGRPDRGGYAFDSSAEYFIMLIFIIYSFFNIFISPNVSFFACLLFSVIFLGCIRRLKDDYLRVLLKYIIVAMVLSSVLSLFNMDKIVADYATSFGDVQRLAWKDSNYTSFFIGVIVLMSLFYASRTSSKSIRNGLYAVALLLLICLCLLISRGSIISLTIACLFYFRNKIFSSKIISYGLLLGILGFVLYDNGLFDGIIARFNSEDMEDGSGRTIIWSLGLNTFQNKGILTVLFGGGVGSANQMAFLGGIYFSPHNNFLEILYNFGIIGLVIFVLWWIVFYVRSSKEKKALVIFIMTNCMTICPFTYVQPIWIIVPLIMIWDSRINKLIC